MRTSALVVTAVAAFRHGASAQLIDPITVELSVSNNTLVHANVTNTGNSTVKLLTIGSLLHANPEDRLQIYQAGGKLDYYSPVSVFIISDLADDAFEDIASGASVHNTSDIATNYDLSAGGVFDIASEGVFYTVNLNSTVHTYGQALEYSSNPISATIDGDAAKRAHGSYHAEPLAKRGFTADSKNSDKQDKVKFALDTCTSYAGAAVNAVHNSKRKIRYGAEPGKTKAALGVGFTNIYNECHGAVNEPQKSKVDYFCNDVYNQCKPGMVFCRHSTPTQDSLIFCPHFLDSVYSFSPSTCHQLDISTVLLKELLEFMQFSPNRTMKGLNKGFYDSCGRNGYKDIVKKCSAHGNFVNVDTWAYFAKGVLNPKCATGPRGDIEHYEGEAAGKISRASGNPARSRFS